MIRISNQKQKDLNIKNIDFQIQDSYKLTFLDQSFDIVIASNLLHLLYEPDKPINEVKRVLKDNGIFIAPTFCVGENMKSTIIANLVGFVSGFKIVNKWRVENFKSMLTRHGFTIDKMVTIDGRFTMVYVVLKK